MLQLDKYKRALAETDNVRKRGERQVQESKQFAIQAFCKDLLEVQPTWTSYVVTSVQCISSVQVADTLQRAIDSVTPNQLLAEDASAPALRTLHDGVQMTRNNLMGTFTKYGLKQVHSSR